MCLSTHFQENSKLPTKATDYVEPRNTTLSPKHVHGYPKHVSTIWGKGVWKYLQILPQNHSLRLGPLRLLLVHACLATAKLLDLVLESCDFEIHFGHHLLFGLWHWNLLADQGE